MMRMSHKMKIICADGDHVVNLNERTCTCRLWSVTGIPCKHAVTAIYQAHRDPVNFLHECYGKDAYLKTYEEQIMPIPGETEWIEVRLPPIQPPVIHRPPGRPKKKRKKAVDEPRNSYQVTRRNKPVHCGKCHKVGHNSRSCKSSITGEIAWQRRMRLKREKEAAAAANASNTQVIRRANVNASNTQVIPPANVNASNTQTTSSNTQPPAAAGSRSSQSSQSSRASWYPTNEQPRASQDISQSSIAPLQQSIGRGKCHFKKATTFVPRPQKK